ncbi:MAG: peptidoglycan D,D-transpeptidase FtsI family protein [Gammaproteobacteria bacterium]
MKLTARMRLISVAVFFVLAAGALTARAVDLQVMRHPFLAGQAAHQHTRTLELPAHRGMILDRNGQPLAISTPVYAIWVNPRVVTGARVDLAPVAKALDLDPAEVARRVQANADRAFLYLARDIVPSEAKAIVARQLPGVHDKREYRRYYPAGPVAASVVGFTNIDDSGLSGLELEYNSWLDGTPGAMRVITSGSGHAVEIDDVARHPQPGHDLTTTLDMRIQYLAYQTLARMVAKQGATSGSVVVLDAHTGGVLAMVNQPSCNPNVRADLKPGLCRNRAVTDAFEPGSSFKPFIIAAALASGKWTPQSTVKTGDGVWSIGGYTLHDDEPLGTITLTRLLQKSSNIGAAKVALSLPSDYLYRVLTGFGFGRPAASGFPGAVDGRMPFYGRWRPVEQAAISRGYGVSVSALELAEGYLAIADNGIYRVASFVKRQGQAAGVRVVPSSISSELRGMLTTVVSDDGTGYNAQIPNYRVAGKTGTARLYKNGGYSDLYNSVFAGMAPAADPRLVVVVVLRGASKGKFFASQIAAPVFRKIMASSLRLMDIAPDDGTVLAQNSVSGKKGPKS